VRKSGLDAPTLALAHAVFFASGIAALLYQVIWQRLLALFSGADVFSVTLIVAAFMGGLGLGNLAGGHFADRASRATCLTLFAMAEGAIGGFALASRALYYDLLYGRLGALDLGLPALGAVLFGSVLWPTFFMGISLPLLARGLTPSLAHAARTVGSLYGWNTLGAAVGAAASTWILLRHFDLDTSLRIGAALNLACAAAAWPLRARIGRDDPAATAPVESAPKHGAEASGFGLSTWLVVYALAGAIALSLEIAWFRVLGVVLKSTSFTFGTLLAIYLLGTAGGSLAGARLAERSRRAPAQSFLALQTIGVAWALAGMLAVHALATPERWNGLFTHFGTTDHGTFLAGLAALAEGGVGALFGSSEPAGAARFFVLLHALLPLAVIAPATFALGMSFPFLQRAIHTDAAFLGRRVGWLQTANIAGSLAGSLLTGFVLLPRLGTPGTFRALGAAALVFPLLAGLSRLGRGAAQLAAPVLGVAALAALVAVFPRERPFWATLHGAALGDFLVAEDAAGVSALLPGSSDTPSILVMAGGVEVSSIPYGGYEGIHTLLGVVPVLLHPDPKRVAVIGIGSGDTAYAAAARPETRDVAAIEIIGSQLDLLRGFARQTREPGLVSFLADPRIRKVITDGRTFVRRDPALFDVIEADALRVTSAYSGNLYSTEYFALLRSKLAPGGFAVSWLPTPRVAETFRRSFPHGLVIGQIGIGAEQPIEIDPATLAARLREPRFAAHFRRVGIEIAPRVEPFLLANPPVAFATAPGANGDADLNSDLFAKDEFLHDGPPR
jgi:predicted membrane-bound spermidine synthase